MSKKVKNPNPHKFGKDRSVDSGWEKIPFYYTGIKHPTNKDKELVVKEFFGKNVEVCWRNNKLYKMGIGQLVPRVKGEFIFKGKVIKFRKRGGYVL